MFFNFKNNLKNYRQISYYSYLPCIPKLIGQAYFYNGLDIESFEYAEFVLCLKQENRSINNNFYDKMRVTTS